MPRLEGFDYRRPLFYMVTLKKRSGVPEFAALAPAGAPPPRDAAGRECWLLANAATRAFAKVIRDFSQKWRGIAPIECFIVMPDHLHLLLKIEDTPERLPLGSYVVHLVRALGAALWESVGQPGGPGTARQHSDAANSSASEFGGAVPGPPPSPVFERDWHDWIVMKRGQLAAFTRYIRENPRRAWLRRENRRFFTRLGKLNFAGREWFAYGNPALLELPVLEPFRCSRSWTEDGPEWHDALARAERTGPGGAGVGTFFSPCEKACLHLVFGGVDMTVSSVLGSCT